MRKYIIFAVCLGLTLGLNIYFRIFTINFPQFKARAANIVEQKGRQEATKEIDAKFPEIDSLAKDKLINAFIFEYKKQQKKLIEKQKKEEYLKLKDKFQDQNGQTYLMELDGWHWARYTENVLRFGHPGDKVVNGRQLDNLMLAPTGSSLLWNNFLFYLSAFLYKAFCLLRPIPLLTFVFYLPLFFISIFIIILYLFCCSRWGNLSAVVSCLFVGLAPMFLQRSCAGWFDTDTLNLLFPLLVVLTYILAYEARNFKLRFFWLLVSGFFVGLFSFTWTSWWFIFLIIILYEFYSLTNIILIYLQYKEKNFVLFKKHLFSLSSFLIFTLFWIIILSGVEPLNTLYFRVKESLILNKPLTVSIWPNVYSTVGELGRVNFLQIAKSIGGVYLFIFSLVSMLLIFLRILRSQKFVNFEYELIIILIFWFMTMFFACFKGQRFAIFLLIPLGISLGWCIKIAYEYLKKRKKKFLAYFSIAIILFVLVINFVSNASFTARGIFPLMDDILYKALTALKENTPKEAIVNSWWDFGDWFKAVSQRRVIFDGQSQNSPQAYWMARALLTDNEEEAIRILRMLNNGGNIAFEIIDKHLKDPFKTIFVLKKLMLSKSEEAKAILLKILPPSATEEVIGLIFNKPDKAYFIVEPSLAYKIAAISFIGNWDFSKTYLAQNITKRPKEQLIDFLVRTGMNNKQAQRLYQEAALISGGNIEQWVSKPSSFYSRLVKGEEKNGIVLFNNGCIYEPKEQTMQIYFCNEAKYKIPKSIFLMKQGKLEEVTYPNKDLDFSVLVFKDEAGYRSLMLDEKLADSLFVRLYFMGGEGLKYFKPFIKEKASDDEYIRVFEMTWD